MLRKTAMNENNKIAEVAQSVVTAAELLKMTQDTHAHRLYPASRRGGPDNCRRHGFAAEEGWRSS